MLIDCLFLPILFFIGLITSYEDYKEGKIKNKRILLGLFWAVFIFVMIFLWNIFSSLIMGYFTFDGTILRYTFEWSYIGKALLNGGIAMIIGYLMWYFDVWSPGDAKLFMVFALLLPLKYYENSFFAFFPSLTLIVNMFLSLFIFILLASCLYLTRKFFQIEQKKVLVLAKGLDIKNNLAKNWRDYLAISFGFLTFFISLQIVRIDLVKQFSFFKYANLIFFFIFLALSNRLGDFFKNKKANFIALFCLLVYLSVRTKMDLVPGFGQFIVMIMKSGLIFMSIFALINFATDFYIKRTDKTLPFALWMFIGVIITIIFRGSPLLDLLSLLEK